MDQTTAFNLLHPGVQRQLWNMKWTTLRPLQVAAIHEILSSDRHSILSAGTAAGKTEAAFLPILSSIADDPTVSVRAMYVGPLKALINDQFGRLEELCQHLNLPVYRWHGDVPAAAKKQLISQPGGVLLITPESIESLFVNRSNALPKLFGGLRFVVIDELHSFLDNERGLHLRSLLNRIESVAEKRPRLVGLSATIGNPSVAIEYLDRDHPESVRLVVGEDAEAELKLLIHAYEGSEPDDSAAEVEEDETGSQDRLLALDLVKHCKGNSNLVFANSRNDVEFFGNECKSIAESQNLPDEFLVHHGSLSAEIRRDTEDAMKSSSRNGKPTTTLCSSTLEMGIDIGSVKMVGQIGAPFSVASLKQRIGRSGRRGDPRILRMYIRCQKVDEKTNIFDRLHLDLIQSIAATELLLQKWVEPAEPCSFDLSTLTQQIISMIAETGGRRAEVLFDRLCQRGAFRDVDANTFRALLRQLGNEDVIEQVDSGDLILGLVGEDLRKDKGFYAVFPTTDAYAVLQDGAKIGAVEAAPRVGEHMLLAGRRWQVVDVDDRQKAILVIPAAGRKSSPFAGRGGRLHEEIAKMMRTVLADSKAYPYLGQVGSVLLADARQVATSARVCSERFVFLSPNKTAVFAWVGHLTFNTLLGMLQVKGITASPERIAVVIDESIEKVRSRFNELADTPPAAELIAKILPPQTHAKYSPFLNTPFLNEATAMRSLDVKSATRWLCDTT